MNATGANDGRMADATGSVTEPPASAGERARSAFLQVLADFYVGRASHGELCRAIEQFGESGS